MLIGVAIIGGGTYYAASRSHVDLASNNIESPSPQASSTEAIAPSVVAKTPNPVQQVSSTSVIKEASSAGTIPAKFTNLSYQLLINDGAPEAKPSFYFREGNKVYYATSTGMRTNFFGNALKFGPRTTYVVVSGADAQTFKPVSLEYGVDKNSVYFRSSIISEADIHSFFVSSYCGDVIGLDRYHKFVGVQIIGTGPFPTSASPIGATSIGISC